MVSAAWTQPAGGYLANSTFPAITLEFAYDGLSRRVQKKSIIGGTTTMEGYLYDGRNVVMISNLDPANQSPPARKWSCVWRPDIGSRLYARGSWEAAGGVGGLAWMQTGIAQTVAMFSYQEVSGNGEVHIPMMDHMGNVRHYYQIKTTASAGPSQATVNGQLTANLDYDAFGREVRATGPKTPSSAQPPGLSPNDPWVDNLPFHFSTKFTDRESGLNYYGYRFYDSIDGRWLNRDPIEEVGGVNLYLIGRDAAVTRWDYLGLRPSLPPGWHGPGQPYDPSSNPFDRSEFDRLREELERMRREGHDKYPGVPNSKMRHCVTTCEAAKKFGAGTARAVGIANEVQGLLRWDLTDPIDTLSGERDPAFQLSDLLSNELGIICSGMDCTLCCRCMSAVQQAAEDAERKAAEERRRREEAIRQKLMRAPGGGLPWGF